MKKAISLVLALCMILSLAACGQRTDDNASTPDNTGTAEKTVITGSISHSSAPDSTYDIGAHYFADLVKEYTDGTVILEIYPSAQLGSDKEAFEGHRMGSVDFSMPGASMLSQYKENIAVFNLPFLFSSREDAYKVLDSELADEIYSSTEEVGPNVGDSLSELLILQLVDNGKQLAHFGAVKRVLLQNDCLLFRVNGRESGNSLPFSALLRMNQSSGTAQQR